MPPKPKFSREQIVEAAFEIAKAEGIDSITIRKVAEKLGSSIAPIYVNFTDVNELKSDVIKKTAKISNEMIYQYDTGNPFYDIGVASVKFAKEYSVLFRDLVLKQNDYHRDFEQEVDDNIIAQMKKDPDLSGFTTEGLMDILFKMRVFHMGLSVMVANGMLPQDFTEDKMIEILKDTATDVITASRLRKG